MSISPLLFPAAYFLLFIIWAAFSLANVYHVMRYASWTRMPLVLTSIYFLLAFIIIGATGILLRDVDWQQDIDFPTPDISIPNELPGIGTPTNSFDNFSQ